jgi:hypothetical protein
MAKFSVGDIIEWDIIKSPSDEYVKILEVYTDQKRYKLGYFERISDLLKFEDTLSFSYVDRVYILVENDMSSISIYN